MNSIYLSIGLLIFICILVYIYKPKTLYTRYGIIDLETFKANSNITSQSPMNFNYITNKNYLKNILEKYYINDDTKINGKRTVYHPYIYTYNRRYGLLWFDPARSNSIYQNTGVRL